MITITKEQIDTIIEDIKQSIPSLSPELQIGDWVKLNELERGEAYTQGIVTSTNGGEISIKYGSKDDYYFDIYGQVDKKYISEIWRRIDVVKRSNFPSNGKMVKVTSIEYEWRQVL